jgi:uncharacterized RDD family membrane protein YckC
MQKIKIETTQNVTIEYEVASVGDRVSAALFDGLFLAIYIAAITLLNMLLSDRAYNQSIVIVKLVVLYLIPVLFYDLIMETFFNGQSLGKKIQKIQVIKMNGSKPGFISYFLRWILRFIDISFSFGKGQRLGDLAANTTVIKTPDEIKLGDTIFTNLRKDYVVQFLQVSLLKDNDISLIKEVIEKAAHISDPYVYDQLVGKAVSIISAKIGVEVKTDRMVFLRTIVDDYNYVSNNYE